MHVFSSLAVAVHLLHVELSRPLACVSVPTPLCVYICVGLNYLSV